MDWRILKEQNLAKQAEKYGQSLGGDFGASGDFGESNLPPISGTPSPFEQDVFGGLGSSTSKPVTPMMPFNDPRPIQKRNIDPSQFDVSDQSIDQYTNKNFTRPKTTLDKVGDFSFPDPFSLDPLTGIPLKETSPAGLIHKAEPYMKTAASPLLGAGALAAHAAGYGPDQSVGETIGGTVKDAAAGPFALMGADSGNGLVHHLRGLGSEIQQGLQREGMTGPERRTMLYGAIAEPAAEALSFPGDVLPGMANPAQAIGRGVAGVAERAGVYNPTMRQIGKGIVSAGRAMPGEIARFHADQVGSLQIPVDLRDRLYELAKKVASKLDNSGEPEIAYDEMGTAYQAAAERPEVASMDKNSIMSLMRDAIKGEASKENRRGVRLKNPGAVADRGASRQTAAPDDSLNLSPEAQREILGEPDLATGNASGKATTYAPRDDTPGLYSDRLARVKKGIEAGGDVDQVMKDAERLPREDIFKIAKDLGGDAQRNKQKGLDVLRAKLEAKSMEPTQPPTTYAGRQEAKELELANKAVNGTPDFEAEAKRLFEGPFDESHAQRVSALGEQIRSLPASELTKVADSTGLRFSGQPTKKEMIQRIVDRLNTQRGDDWRTANADGSQFAGSKPTAIVPEQGVVDHGQGTGPGLEAGRQGIEGRGPGLQTGPGQPVGGQGGPNPAPGLGRSQQVGGEFTKQLDREMLFGQQGHQPDFSGGKIPPGWKDISNEMPPEYAGSGWRWVKNPQGHEFVVGPEGEMSIGRQLPFLESVNNKEVVFHKVADMRLEGRNDLASQALKEAGLSEQDYSAWRKGRSIEKPSAPLDAEAIVPAPPAESKTPTAPETPQRTHPESSGPTIHEPRPASDFSREGISYPKIASTVREDFTGYYANQPNSERANEFANRIGAIEHRGRNAAQRLMPEAARADESMVKSVGWKETAQRPARKEMLQQIKDPDVPNFSYYKFTAGIDDAVAGRVGRPQFADPRAKQWVEQTYPALYHDTGAAFESAGGLQRGPNGQTHDFVHDPLSTQGPHVDNMLEPWMGDPTNPKMKRYAEDLASIPENKAAGVTAEQVIKDTSEIRSKADRREAFENDRRVPIKPDIWTDPVDGQTHLVNAAALRLLPSKDFGGGLQPWFLKQHMRASVVDDIGTPSLMDTDQGLNYYRQQGGLREGVVSEAEARNPGTGAGAGEAADRMLAAVMGNSEHAGYNFSQKLAPDSSPIRAIREGLKTSAESAIARTWFKSLLQPYFEIPGMAPGGTLNRLAYVGKTAALQARYTAASGLRLAQDWLNIPKARNVANRIASTEADQMSAQGVATNFTEALTAGFKGAAKDMGVDLFNGPQAGMPKVIDVGGKTAEKGAKLLGVWNVLSNKMNNFVAGLHDWTASKLGEDMAKDYLAMARDGKLNTQQIQRLERMGANPDSISEIAKINQGTKAGVVSAPDPVFDAQFGKELARAVPWDTQFRGASPLRRQRFLNDKFYGQLFKFMTFQMGTVRHGEEFFNELQSAKTMADRMDAVGRLAFRVGGSQLQGEVARGLADAMGKDRTNLEDDSLLGRVGMNMIYSSFMGPLWLAFDYSAQKAGMERPWAKRGAKTEQALGPKDMIFNTQPVETFLQLTGAPVMSGLAEAGVLDRKSGHEDDTVAGTFKKAILRQSAVNDAGRMIFGNDAMNNSGGGRQSGGGAPQRGLFEKAGSRGGLFEKRNTNKGLFEKSSKKGLFDK